MPDSAKLDRAVKKFKKLRQRRDLSGGQVFNMVCREFEISKKTLSDELKDRRSLRHGRPQRAEHDQDTQEPRKTPQKAQGTLDFGEETMENIQKIAEMLTEDPEVFNEMDPKVKMAGTLQQDDFGIRVPHKTIMQLMKYISSGDMPQVYVTDSMIHLTWDSGQEMELYFDEKDWESEEQVAAQFDERN